MLQVFILVSVSCFVVFDMSSIVFVLFLLLCAVQSLALFMCLCSVFSPNSNSGINHCFDWHSWHMIGGFLVSLPVTVVFLSLNEALKTIERTYYFTSLFFVGIIHFCNFTQLNCWMKSSIATIAGLIYLFIMVNNFKSPYISGFGSTNLTYVQMKSSVPFNNLSSPFYKSANYINQINIVPIDVRSGDRSISPDSPIPIINNFNNNKTVNSNWLAGNLSVLRSVVAHSNKTTFQDYNYNTSIFVCEIYFDVLLILFLVWFLNREFEISYRLSFHGNIVAARDKTKVQMMRDQAEILLHNIIPRHVAEHLKTTAK